ncbi:efflux RND transporter periplasmic adaptor subunit [Microcoleus sp. FACHB-672]|uniref:efflux RND transporter periplasmic adaptor subunit n=1 Tax=Microcoleus sp. FACHB-672 TaxID=2692825 RepID=UPI0016884C8F|nr:efflux RND transporter periplasmic adaptor subunit [Microcoleus sp. FACHB-672]MBD2041873.1 efflux RND transporter periplasmic adaptor subunit [Microcoleus sp. FACHB-672]
MTKTNDSKFSEKVVADETEPAHFSDDTETKEYLVSLPDEDEDIDELPRKSGKKSGRIWLGILGTIILLAGAGFGWQQWQLRNGAAGAGGAPQQAAGQPQGVPVKLAPVAASTVEDSTEFVGTLDAQQSVALKSEIDGLVKEIYVGDGDLVEKGDAIARIENEDAQAQLRQAKANQMRAEARLRDLQAGSRPEEIAQGQSRVAQAQARLTDARGGARPEEIAQAEAQIQGARADAELSRQRLDRYRDLAREGAVPQDTLDQYIQEDRSARAELEEAQRRLEQLQKSRSSDIERLEAELAQQQQALKQLENGSRPEEIAQAEADVAAAVAQVRNNEAVLEKAQILSPFAGKIGDFSIKSGDYVTKGTQITTVTQNSALDLRMSIPLERASDLRVGLPVQLLNAQGEPAATGQISFISPEVNANSQAVVAKASFGNSTGDLLSRQFVRTKVIWDKRPGILVPVNAISRLGGQTFVFVAETNEQSKLIARQKPVKLGSIQGNNYQVIEGLKAGENLVVSGILNLTDGAPIIPEAGK